MHFYRSILNSKWVPSFFKDVVEKIGKKLYFHLYRKNIFFCDRYEMNVLGYSFAMWLDWRDKTDILFIVSRVYEEANTHFVISTLKEGDIFIDIGANVGYFSLLADALGRKVKVYAVEPLTRNLYSLSQAVKQTNIRIVPAAVSDVDGETELVSRTTNSGSPSIVNYFGEGLPVKEVFMNREIVKTKTISTIFKEENITQCTIVKMDVQGAEYLALKGAEELLKNKRIQYLIIEHNSSQYEMRARDFLAQYGYLAYKINKNGSIVRTDQFINKQDYVYTYKN